VSPQQIDQIRGGILQIYISVALTAPQRLALKVNKLPRKSMSHHKRRRCEIIRFHLRVRDGVRVKVRARGGDAR